MLHVGALRAVGVDGELDMPPLDGMRVDARQIERVCRGRVQTRRRATPAFVILSDEDRVGKKDLGRSSRRVRLEGHLRRQVTFIEAVEIDLESASHVRLVVGSIVER